MRVFEPLIRHVIAQYGQVDSIQAAPRSADVWVYQIEGQVPVLAECHITDQPVTREKLSAFFGELKMAQIRQPDVVGVLLTTGEFTASTADSAHSHYQTIRRQSPDEPFHIYDADQILALLAERRRVAAFQEITDWFDGNSSSGIVSHDLILTRSGEFWALGLGGPEKGCHLLLEPFGRLVSETVISSLPWSQITDLRKRLTANSLVNNLYADRARPLSRLPALGTEPSSQQQLLDLIGSHRVHRQQIEELVKLARGRLCEERGDSVCAELERWSVTFFDTIASSCLAFPIPGDQSAMGKFVDEACTSVAALRISALLMSASWIHNRQRGSMNNPRAFVTRLMKDLGRQPTWFSLLPGKTAAICKAVSDLSGSQPFDADDKLVVVAGLAIHLGGAFGPYCGTYRTTIHQNLLLDSKPELSGAPTFSSSWIDTDSQQLRVVVDVQTPRSHRYVTTNRVLLLPVLERAEDALGRLGERVPFTRINITTNNAEFELVECFFELESEYILKIFMGEELYSNKEVWIRELLQNAIDATLLRKALIDEDNYRPEICISYGFRDREFQIIDNGMGMALYHVRKFFSKVGRSFYRSPELVEELKRKNKKFDPISRFGVGFLSVFMMAHSAEILTRHVQAPAFGDDVEDVGLSVFIPGLMEDFYLRKVPDIPQGTKVTLELKKELKDPIEDLVTRYLLCPPVDITVISAKGRRAVIEATRELSVFPTVVGLGRWSSSFEIISVLVSSDDYEAMICIPVPKPGYASSDRRHQTAADNPPETRIAVAQAGIWVKDDNALFGEKRGPGDMYHPYFRRVYGLINFKSGALKINVARNEFVLDEHASTELNHGLLSRAIDAMERQVAATAAEIASARRRNEYLRAVMMDSVQDGEEYYASYRKPLSQYDFANSELLKNAMARLYAAYYTLEQRGQDAETSRTVADVIRTSEPGAEMYYTLTSDMHEDPLFLPWLAERPNGSQVFYSRSRREAALLMAAFKQEGYTRGLTELKQDMLQMAIHFSVIRGPLDDYLKACAGVVRFGDYKPSTALLVMPVTPLTVSKKQGLNYNRSVVSGDPYVLLNVDYWLTAFLIEVASLTKGDTKIDSLLRDLCEALVRNIALGEGVGIRQEALQVVNNILTKLYAQVEQAGEGHRFECVGRLAMVTLAELVGTRSRRR